MRVIAGTARGHKLKTPGGYEIRPTADRTKEALFSIISNEIEGSRFLDLFSGSGAIGIEALSRGAGFCVMAEENKSHCDIIKHNLAHVEKALGGRSNYSLINARIPEGLKTLKGQEFDIIFMDPPYGKGLAAPALAEIKIIGLLKKGGFIIIEQSSAEDKPANPHFELIKHKKYGAASIYILTSL